MQATATDSAPARGTGRRRRRRPTRCGPSAPARPCPASACSTAPVRWPRPSRLAAPLSLQGKRMAAGAAALGLDTVGDLLVHLPSDSRESRTLSELRAGEPATVEVVVRSIAARPVRRRGMRPLVEARVADPSGSLRARFFNQPWLVDRYPPGTRLLLHGKPDGRGGFGVSHHAPAAARASSRTQPARAAAARERSPTIRPARVSARPRSSRSCAAHAAALADFPELLPAALRVARRVPGQAGGAGGGALRRGPGRARAGRRRLAFEELLFSQLLFLRRRARRRARTGAHRAVRAAAADRALAGAKGCRSRSPRISGGRSRRSPATWRASAPMQRLLMGEVGSGKTVSRCTRCCAPSSTAARRR